MGNLHILHLGIMDTNSVLCLVTLHLLKDLFFGIESFFEEKECEELCLLVVFVQLFWDEGGGGADDAFVVVE